VLAASIIIWQATRRIIPEDRHLLTHRRENLKLHIPVLFDAVKSLQFKERR
jgi:hypothetical protein